MKKSMSFLRAIVLAGLGAASMLASTPLYADSVDPAVSADHKIDVPEKKGKIDIEKQFNFSAGYMSSDGGKLGAPAQAASVSGSINHPILFLGGAYDEPVQGGSVGLYLFGAANARVDISPSKGVLTRSLNADLLSVGWQEVQYERAQGGKEKQPWLTHDLRSLVVGVVDERDAFHGNQKTGVSLTLLETSLHVVKENKGGLPIEFCAGLKSGEYIGAGRLFGAESIGGSDPLKTDSYVTLVKLNACMGLKLGAVGLLRGEVGYGIDRADVSTADGFDKRYTQYLGGAVSLENIGSPRSPVYVRAEAQRKISETDNDEAHDILDTRMGVSAGFAF